MAAAGPGTACARCGVPLEGRAAFRLGSGPRAAWKCLGCALVDRGLALRSGKVALLVGTALVALNQGDQLLAGTFPWAQSWYKIPLTFLVPLCVAGYGALANGYRGAGTAPDRPPEPGPEQAPAGPHGKA